jgi:excisionase family DNA binding protein
VEDEGSKLLTTTEVAKRLAISAARVRQLIYAGRIPSVKIGNANVVDEKDLDMIRERNVGRPPKEKK